MAERRLFFALWPEPAVQRAIADAARSLINRSSLNCRPVRIEGIHLTLLFLGNVAEEREAELAAIAAKVPFQPFSLSLDLVDSFPGAKVLWIGPRRTPPALADLARDLRERCKAAGFEFDEKKLVPHVTVARNVDRNAPPAALAPIEWNVTGFALVHSAPGSRYHVVSHWPVQNGATDLY